jgi:hypothetical protein
MSLTKDFLDEPGPVDLESSLPEVGWKMWTARRKATVVIAVCVGTLSKDHARERYSISEEEFASWEEHFAEDGLCGLQIKHYRPRSPHTSRRRRTA